MNEVTTTAKLNKNGKVEFTFESELSDFKDERGIVIGKSKYINIVELNSKEEALTHLKGQVEILNNRIIPIQSQYDKINFNDEKFGNVCKAIVDNNASVTQAKFKELNKLVEVYKRRQAMELELKMLKENKEKIENQIKLVENLK